ncbi:MAG: hypothetical protein ABI577_16865 [bacterium]
MHVELSERARERLERLVEDGSYPSVEAAIEAAVASLRDSGFAGVDVEVLARQAEATRKNNTSRLIDGAYEAELAAKLNGIIAPHRNQ